MKKLFLLLLLFFTCHLQAQENRKTVCLNMIVKNEKEIIARCLESVKHLIDYWVIFDTGSTDETQEIIRKTLKNIPGELHQSSWVDFATNRNEAMAAAKGKADYLFFIDADERCIFTEDFTLPTLEKDSYLITVRMPGSVDGTRTGFINNHLDWKWEGALHEVIQCAEAMSCERLKEMMILCDSKKGARCQDKSTFLKDALVLEKALQKDPENCRNVFYLAQSYENAGCDETALGYYQKRLAMPSADIQETYHAIYRVGVLQEKLQNYEEAIRAFSSAYLFRQARAEPLFHLAKIYRTLGNYLVGYFITKNALTMPYPEGELCIEYQIYDYVLLIEFANCALLLGKFQEGKEACEKLLANPNLPEEYRVHVASNLELANNNLVKKN